MRADLAATEDGVLRLLASAAGNLLADEAPVEALARAKATAAEAAARVAEAEAAERDTDAAREAYRPAAARAALLFFAVADLAAVDPMYQFSLSWLTSLFVQAMDDTPPDESAEARVRALVDALTFSVYAGACRALFERHKLMFAVSVAVRVLERAGGVDSREWRFLLAGPSAADAGAAPPPPNPGAGAGWLGDAAWAEAVALSRAAPAFAGFDRHLADNAAHYRSWAESADISGDSDGGGDNTGSAERAPELALAEPFASRLSGFQRLLAVRCLRPDRLLAAARDFVAATLGARFAEPPAPDLAECFRDAGPLAPLIFILAPGADPMADLLAFADRAGFGAKFERVSLGQGQGPKAARAVAAAMERGGWVCLQNCHLAGGWMPGLERLVEGADPERVHRDFRLFLTSAPAPDFPAPLLRRGVKAALEPPAGPRAALLRQYARFTEARLARAARPREWRRLVFALCLLHAAVQGRRAFGPLGWAAPYDFSDGDLSITLAQLHELLEEHAAAVSAASSAAAAAPAAAAASAAGEELAGVVAVAGAAAAVGPPPFPFRVLRYLAAEVNYGGRVTDARDRRLMGALADAFVSPAALAEGAAFGPGGACVVPGCETVREVSVRRRGAWGGGSATILSTACGRPRQHACLQI